MTVNDNNVASGRLRITVAENPQTDGWRLLSGTSRGSPMPHGRPWIDRPAIESLTTGPFSLLSRPHVKRVPIGQNVKSRTAFRLVSATDLQGSHVGRQTRPPHLVGPSQAKPTSAIGTELTIGMSAHQYRFRG